MLRNERIDSVHAYAANFPEDYLPYTATYARRKQQQAANGQSKSSERNNGGANGDICNGSSGWDSRDVINGQTNTMSRASYHHNSDVEYAIHHDTSHLYHPHHHPHRNGGANGGAGGTGSVHLTPYTSATSLHHNPYNTYHPSLHHHHAQSLGSATSSGSWPDMASTKRRCCGHRGCCSLSCCAISLTAVLIFIALVTVIGVSIYLGLITKLSKSNLVPVSGRLKVDRGDDFSPALLNTTSVEFLAKAGKYETILQSAFEANDFQFAVVKSEVYAFRKGSLLVFFRVLVNRNRVFENETIMAEKKSKEKDEDFLPRMVQETLKTGLGKLRIYGQENEEIVIDVPSLVVTGDYDALESSNLDGTADRREDSLRAAGINLPGLAAPTKKPKPGQSAKATSAVPDTTSKSTANVFKSSPTSSTASSPSGSSSTSSTRATPLPTLDSSTRAPSTSVVTSVSVISSTHLDATRYNVKPVGSHPGHIDFIPNLTTSKLTTPTPFTTPSTTSTPPSTTTTQPPSTLHLTTKKFSTYRLSTTRRSNTPRPTFGLREDFLNNNLRTTPRTQEHNTVISLTSFTPDTRITSVSTRFSIAHSQTSTTPASTIVTTTPAPPTTTTPSTTGRTRSTTTSSRPTAPTHGSTRGLERLTTRPRQRPAANQANSNSGPTFARVPINRQPQPQGERPHPPPRVVVGLPPQQPGNSQNQPPPPQNGQFPPPENNRFKPPDFSSWRPVMPVGMQPIEEATRGGQLHPGPNNLNGPHHQPGVPHPPPRSPPPPPQQPPQPVRPNRPSHNNRPQMRPLPPPHSQQPPFGGLPLNFPPNHIRRAQNRPHARLPLPFGPERPRNLDQDDEAEIIVINTNSGELPEDVRTTLSVLNRENEHLDTTLATTELPDSPKENNLWTTPTPPDFTDLVDGFIVPVSGGHIRFRFANFTSPFLRQLAPPPPSPVPEERNQRSTTTTTQRPDLARLTGARVPKKRKIFFDDDPKLEEPNLDTVLIEDRNTSIRHTLHTNSAGARISHSRSRANAVSNGARAGASITVESENVDDGFGETRPTIRPSGGTRTGRRQASPSKRPTVKPKRTKPVNDPEPFKTHGPFSFIEVPNEEMKVDSPTLTVNRKPAASTTSSHRRRHNGPIETPNPEMKVDSPTLTLRRPVDPLIDVPNPEMKVDSPSVEVNGNPKRTTSLPLFSVTTKIDHNIGVSLFVHNVTTRPTKPSRPRRRKHASSTTSTTIRPTNHFVSSHFNAPRADEPERHNTDSELLASQPNGVIRPQGSMPTRVTVKAISSSSDVPSSSSQQQQQQQKESAPTFGVRLPKERPLTASQEPVIAQAS